ncbi:hypothetical protein VFPPC_16119 [Pochonia chlamydosporia 170]|uniref:Uncharacterized protein n=1 Tax=Pochonia chlamydosporia 170 TaxID=1380566 RepID=A0A179FP79_METCM|nr:hypothetical protein VFPPC_16119 [Pochonia chlamydosporia 170]OAQ67088.1 hypothetical protein VFPPC_16119 [Pochonia chlamydosporia 170]
MSQTLPNRREQSLSKIRLGVSRRHSHAAGVDSASSVNYTLTYFTIYRSMHEPSTSWTSHATSGWNVRRPHSCSSSGALTHSAEFHLGAQTPRLH